MFFVDIIQFFQLLDPGVGSVPGFGHFFDGFLVTKMGSEKLTNSWHISG